MKNTEDKSPPRARAPFTVREIVGIRISVKCPEDGAEVTKIVFPDEMRQEDEKALCPMCHKWRAIRIAEVKTELRKLLQ